MKNEGCSVDWKSQSNRKMRVPEELLHCEFIVAKAYSWGEWLVQ